MRRTQEWSDLPAEEKRSWVESARKTRRAARGRGAPVDQVLRDQNEAGEIGGPWQLATKFGDKSAPLPLARHLISQKLEHSTLADLGKAWNSVVGKLWDEPDEVLDECDYDVPCYLGECIHGLGPGQQDEYSGLCEDLRLSLRHSQLPANCPLCLQFVCGQESRFALIGDHDLTHKLRCDVILLAPVVDGLSPSEFPRELAMLKDSSARGSVTYGWPVIQSETKFILNLVKHSADQWDIYAVTTEPEQLWSINATSRRHLNAHDMREREAHRLEELLAMRLLKKITEPTVADPRRRSLTRRPRTLTRRRRSLTRSSSGEVTDQELEPDQNDEVATSPEPAIPPPGSPEPVVPPPAIPPPPPGIPPPPPGIPRRRHRVGYQWGKSHWEIAPLAVGGCGATCKDHVDEAWPDRVCKKSVTIGKSGLSYDELELRMKRWLLAGLDDHDWDNPHAKRAHHIGMGGMFMHEFAAGLSREQCDRIADGL